jgi:NADH-quinone oxidoreductase subunit J
MTINIILLVALVLSALATVMTARLLRSVVGLALTSAIVAIMMFRLNAPIAAVFELSVCAGLIPAIFISTVGLTQRMTPEALTARRKAKFRTYWLLPILIILAGVALYMAPIRPDVVLPPPGVAESSVRKVLWSLRHIDLLGQIVILLGGAFGVVVLLREVRHEP